jgi:hypothetical protein
MSNAPQLPLMAITLGDPAGVGPEIVLKAAADLETFRLCRSLERVIGWRIAIGCCSGAAGALRRL